MILQSSVLIKNFEVEILDIFGSYELLLNFLQHIFLFGKLKYREVKPLYLIQLLIF